MKSIRAHLTYANVLSTLGVFLLLAGGTAIAAKQLGKNTVGTKQLKKNSVTAAKIKKKAVTRAKIAANAIDATKLADGAVNGAKIADGSVTGTKLATGDSPFTRKVVRLANTGTVPLTAGEVIPVGSYTQAPDELSQFIAGIDVRFGAGCTPPRIAQALLLIDAADPKAPKIENYLGLAAIEDKTAGEVVHRLDFGPFVAFGGLARVPPGAPTPHKFDVLLQGSSCGAGSGVDATGVIVDVIGTR